MLLVFFIGDGTSPCLRPSFEDEISVLSYCTEVGVKNTLLLPWEVAELGLANQLGHEIGA